MPAAIAQKKDQNFADEVRRLWTHARAALRDFALDDIDAAIRSREALLEGLVERYGKRLNEIEYTDFGGDCHEKPHAARVLVFSLLIGAAEALPAEDLERLALASVYHDSRRENDDLDTGHGMRASFYYAAQMREANVEPDALVQHALAFHDLDDMLGCGLAVEPKKRLLTQIFKDADALDRYRFGADALDMRFLRRAPSSALGLRDA